MRKLFFILSILLLSSSYSFSWNITSPAAGSKVLPGQIFRLEWEEADTRTVKYEYTLVFVGVVMVNGIPKEKTETKTGTKEDHTPCTRAPERWSDNFTVPCNAISGKYTATVKATAKDCGGDYREAGVATTTFDIDPDLFIPLAPQTKINCKKGQIFRIDAPVTLAGYSVYWFDQNDYFLHKGKYFSKIFNSGPTVLKYCMVKNNTNCTESENYNKAVKTYVVVYTLDFGALIGPIELESETLTPDRDYRDKAYIQCADRKILLNTNLLNTQFEVVFGQLNQAFTVFNSVGVVGEVNFKPEFTWYVKDNYGNPFQTDLATQQKYVCYSNLDPAPDGCRTYYCKLKLKTKAKFSYSDGQTSTNAGEDQVEDCLEFDFLSVKYCQLRDCIADFVGVGLFLDPPGPSNPNGGTPGNEQITLCPNNAVAIGPNANQYNYNKQNNPTGGYTETSYSFLWNNSNGLSNTTVKRPTLSYNDLTLTVNTYGRRVNRITETIYTRTLPEGQNDPSEKTVYNEYKWITDFYRCKWCNQKSLNGEGENQEEMMLETQLESNSFVQGLTSFKLFPNPATSFVNILFLEETNPVKITVIDLLGAEKLQISILDPNDETKLDLGNFEHGLYFIKCDFKDAPSEIQKLIIN